MVTFILGIGDMYGATFSFIIVAGLDRHVLWGVTVWPLSSLELVTGMVQLLVLLLLLVWIDMYTCIVGGCCVVTFILGIGDRYGATFSIFVCIS